MNKIKLFLFILIPLIAAIVSGLAWSVLHTQTGAQWLIGQVEKQAAGALQIEQLEGDLGSGLLLRGLSYHDASQSIRIGQVQLMVNLDFFPLSIQIDRAVVDSIEIKQTDAPAASTPPADLISSLNLPVAISFHDLQAREISLVNSDGTVLFAADRIDGVAMLEDSLVIERIFLKTADHEINLSGELGLATPFTLTTVATIQTLLTGESTPQQKTIIQADITGNLDQQLRLSLNTENPPLIMDGTVDDPLNKPQWKLDIQSPGLSWPLESADEADFSVDGLVLTTEGWIDDYRLIANGMFFSPGFEPVNFQLQSRGDTAGLELSGLALTGESVDLTASGELAWLESFEISLSTLIQRIEPGLWIDGWPDQHPVSGQADFALAGSDLEFSAFHLETAGTSFQVNGQGRVSIDEGTIEANLNWQDFQWPPGSAGQMVGSSEGAFQVSGVIDDWKAIGTAAIEAPGLPNGKLQVDANGSREQAKIRIIEGRLLGGVINGDAQLNWLNSLQWATNLNSSGIEIERILPDWPARINTNLSASGTTEPLKARITVHQLDGEYKTIPLAARGSLGISDGVPEFENFNLSLGKSSIDLNGELYSARGLQFTARIEDLSSIQAHGRGEIQASGQFSMNKGIPRLALDLEATDFGWNDIRAKTISIHDSSDDREAIVANLDIKATGLVAAGQSLDELGIELRANQWDQVIRLSALGSDLALTSEIIGGFIEPGEDFYSSGWTGEVSLLTLSASDRVTLALQNAAPIEWTPTSAEIGLSCLVANDSSSLCVEGDWVQDDHFAATFKLNQVPVSIARPFLDTDLEMTQTIDGELVWSATADKPSSGKAEFLISAGEIRYPDDFDSLLKTGEGRISFNLAKGKLSEGKILLPLPDIGSIDFDLNIPDVASGLDARVDGHLRIALSDLNVITLAAPAIDQAGGQFVADVDLIGTISDPHFSGDISLTDGLIRHYASGLRLDEIELSGKVQANDQATLSGSFKALEGTGEITGKIDITDLMSPELEIGLRGKNLKLFDAKDLTLVAEPDIRLGLRPGAIQINGSILVPSAHIAPNFIPETSVEESPDLVIVAGGPDITEAIEEEETALLIRGELEVTLGDKVELELDHAKAKLAGSAKFTWQDAPVPIATGQYNLVGQINALGQRLEISQGTISFPGIPADNPHLNVRAEREIFGNSDIRTAGVFVTGTLRRFSMEPYTEPMTNRERARTLLITGSDFNMEEGVGAVDIGAYIAPRIFVSYGIGVFDDENVVSVRYDLGRGWGVKATSGQQQTGLDLSYTIER